MNPLFCSVTTEEVAGLDRSCRALLGQWAARSARVVVLIWVMAGVAVGCRATRTEEGKPKPRIIRAGQPHEAPELELSEADERMIEAHARFAAGWLEDYNEAPEKAVEHFQMAVRQDPENEILAMDTARKLMELGRLEDARKLLESSASRTNASGMVWGSLGLVYSLQQNRPAAIDANQEAIRRMPRSIAGYQMLARVYLGAGQFAEALNVLDEAGRQPGTDASFLMALADSYSVLRRVRQPPGADLRPRILELLDRVLAMEPSDPTDRFRLAELYQQAGAEEKALPILQQLVAAYPDLPGLRTRLTGLYLRSDHWEKAAEQLREVVKEQPTNPLFHYFLGVLALEAKRVEEAITSFNKVLLLRPDSEDVHMDIAGTYLTRRQAAEALKVLEKVRVRFRPTFQLEFFSAVAALDLKRYDDAVRFFTAAEVMGGAFSEEALDHVFFFQSGVAYERLKRFDDAVLQFEKAIEKKPDFAEALNYLGYMWAERGENLDRAKELIDRAVKLEPENEAFLDSLAWVLHQQGKSEEALPHQLRAIELAKEPDATLLDHLGDIYRRLNRLDEARKAWRRAQELEPKEEVQKKLDEIGS